MDYVVPRFVLNGSTKWQNNSIYLNHSEECFNSAKTTDYDIQNLGSNMIASAK